MEERTIRIRLGVAVVMFIMVTIFLAVLFGRGKMPSLFSNDYKIHVDLDEAPMLSQNSPVYKNGVEIGRVTEVALVEEDRKVRITARIDGKIKLYTNEECWLSLNLLGQSALNFKPNPDFKPDDPDAPSIALKPGTIITGKAPINLLDAASSLQGDLSKALGSVTLAADQFTSALQKVNEIVGTPDEVARKQERLEQTVDLVTKTLESLNRLSGGVEELLNDPAVKEGIKSSTTALPQLISDAKTLMINVNGMIADTKTILGRVDGTFGKVDANLDNISKFTESLGEDGPKLLESLSQVGGELNDTVQQLHQFSQSLNNPDGSIGQMLSDPEFFQNLNRTVKKAEQSISNFEQITQQLQPILRDVNVFSDKIARDPGIIGLKGVFTKTPPIKGIPNAYANSLNSRSSFGNSYLLDDTRSFDSNATYYDGPQQRERIQLIRSPRSKLWPFGALRFRNEPVMQSRYANQVVDLSPYGVADDQVTLSDEMGETYHNQYLPSPAMIRQPYAVAPRPVQTMPQFVPQPERQFALQYAQQQQYTPQYQQSYQTNTKIYVDTTPSQMRPTPPTLIAPPKLVSVPMSAPVSVPAPVTVTQSNQTLMIEMDFEPTPEAPIDHTPVIAHQTPTQQLSHDHIVQASAMIPKSNPKNEMPIKASTVFPVQTAVDIPVFTPVR